MNNGDLKSESILTKPRLDRSERATSSSLDRQKMLYRLEPDEEGYPPVSVEGLWVRPLDSGAVVLDNIPFYARGVAPGDELAVTVDANCETWFEALASSGEASVFRIHAGSDSEIPRIRGNCWASARRARST